MNNNAVTRVATKESAIRFFDQNSQLWTERYSVSSTSDQLWNRHHAILDMVDHLQLAAAARIIDVGCGAGLLTVDLARKGFRGAGVDGAANMISACQDRASKEPLCESWEYKQADVEQIPYPDQSFDAAICSGVIEYLPEDGGLLREVKRILRPGGHFILCVTNKYGYTNCLYPVLARSKRIPGVVRMGSAIRRALTGGRYGMMKVPIEVRRHGPAQIRHALTANGFRVESDRFTQFSLFPTPLCTVFSTLEHAVNLDFLEKTIFRVIGSCYLLSASVGQDVRD